MNNVPENTPLNKRKNKEQEYWQEQLKRQKASGLSRKVYCQQHQLNYSQFGYWERKWRKETERSDKLLPVNLNSLLKINDKPQLETLCTVAFKNGHELKIHDKTVLPLLLSMWS